ncbi:MAG: iron dicitrate transport regulator FecR [Sphingomonas sp.]|nr:MAG: iron dicitrate transport regulator FecR [Sphingomonas sp.]
MSRDRQIDQSAIDWVIRQRDPAFDGWEAFADWLAADPAHAEAYHRVAALDDDLGALTAAPIDEARPFAPAPVFTRRNIWLSAAVAASLAVVVGVSALRPAPTYRVETAMGEQRVISIADGSRIELNGGTRLLLYREDDRRVVLERGQANFRVVHRADAPFRVAAGPAQLMNIGTVFDVTRGNDLTIVAVSEGAVAYNPDTDNVRIDAGKRLSVQDGSGKALLAPVDPASVGAWREGQFVYDDVPLEQVADEIARTTGMRIRVAPEAANIRFRGVLDGRADEARIAADLAALSGTRAVAEAGGWTLSR